MHHKYYMRERSRGPISYVHIWWGRVLLALGVINGGVGISMTGNRNGLAIPYAVLAAVTFVAWAAVKLVRHYRIKNGIYTTNSSSSGHELHKTTR